MSASLNWFDLGLALKLSYTDLKNFREMYRGDNKACLRETLACRLQSGDPLTWGGMCTALRNSTVARNDVAEAIEGSYQSKLMNSSRSAYYILDIIILFVSHVYTGLERVSERLEVTVTIYS